MNLENCFICKRPVFELHGQFDKFDTYFLKEDDLAYQQGAFGWCHTSCLSKSPWAEFWTQRVILHFTQVRGFIKLFSNDFLTILFNPRIKEKYIFLNDGVSFTIKDSMLKHKKEFPGGFFLPIFEEMNLELDDREFIRNIRETLVKTKSFPLKNIIEHLNLQDYLLYPDAVIDGKLCFNKSLERYWGNNWVSADISYNQFIPQEVLELVLRNC